MSTEQWREEAQKVWTEQGRAHWVNMSGLDSFVAGYLHARTEKAASIALQLATETYLTAEEARKLGAGAEYYAPDRPNYKWVNCGLLENFPATFYDGEVIKYRAIKPEPAEQAAHPPALRKPITADDVTDEMIAVVKKLTPMQGVVTSERIAAAYNAVNTRLTETKEGK